MKRFIYYSIIFISINYSFAQDYFLENFGPYKENIQTSDEVYWGIGYIPYYFPIQKFEKMFPRISSVVTSPVIVPIS